MEDDTHWGAMQLEKINHTVQSFIFFCYTTFVICRVDFFRFSLQGEPEILLVVRAYEKYFRVKGDTILRKSVCRMFNIFLVKYKPVSFHH